jgi:hypothetical protein
MSQVLVQVPDEPSGVAGTSHQDSVSPYAAFEPG